MSMLIKPPEESAKEMLQQLPPNITLQDFIVNVLSVYPVELGAFKILRKENGVEVLNFPFNPPIVPIAIMIQEAMNSAVQPQTDQDKMMLGKQVNNILAQIMMENIFMNREAIEGETGIRLEDFLNKKCEFVRQAEKTSSIILADSEGNVQGDIIEIGIDF